jgi:ABC-type lipoprotein export system ATPase subunit
MAESRTHVMHLPVSDPDKFWARRRELSALENTLSRERRHAAVVGPAGSGRTSLLETVREVLRRSNATTVSVRWRPTYADLMARQTAFRSC